MSGRTRWPIVGAFAWFGALWGSLAVVALDVQESLGVGPGGFGALLAVGFALGSWAQLAGGRSVERGGEAGALRRAVLLTVAAFVGVAIAPATLPLAIAIVATLTAAGALNATMNACAASAVGGETRGFLRFHAWFSAGGLAGALVTATIEGAGGSWRLVWLALGVAGAVVAAATPRLAGDRPSSPLGSTPSMRSVASLLRAPATRDAALLLCAAVVAAGAVDTWGVRYLRIERGASVVGGAGAYALGQLFAVVARLRLVPASPAQSATPVAGAAALLAAGLLLERGAPVAWLAGVGLAIAAVAAALVVPLLLARGGAGDRPAATIAAIGAVGQLGFVIGPALIGAASSVGGSGAGLLVAAAVAAGAAVGALRRLSVDAVDGVGDCDAAMRGVESTSDGPL